jgi:hypothetical protein
LRSLRNLEALNVFLLPAALIYVWNATGGNVGWAVRVLALVPLCCILAQGSLYWHLKIRSLVDGASLPAYFPASYRFFELSDVAALGVPSVALLATLLSGRASMTDAACSASLLAFATVEHVNYSAWQLMHDNVNDLRYLRRHRRLRQVPLAEDLRRSSRMPPGNRRIFRRSLAEAFSETELRALGLLGNPRYFGASSTWVEAS